MTITLFLSPGDRTGPGMQITAETDQTAASTHPFMFASVQDAANTETLTTGQAVWDGLASSPTIAQLGVSLGTTLEASSPLTGLADAALVDVTISFVDDSGTRDTQQFTGFAWDAVSGLSGLLRFAGGSGPLPTFFPSFPSSYTLGTVHSGLSGSGALSPVSSLGVLVAATTIPSSWGRTSDIPPRFVPSYGVVQRADVNGELDATFLNYANQLVFNPYPSETEILYTFRPLWVASITEVMP